MGRSPVLSFLIKISLFVFSSKVVVKGSFVILEQQLIFVHAFKVKGIYSLEHYTLQLIVIVDEVSI